MKLFLDDDDIEILMKKYGDPISNEVKNLYLKKDQLCNNIKRHKGSRRR